MSAANALPSVVLLVVLSCFSAIAGAQDSPPPIPDTVFGHTGPRLLSRPPAPCDCQADTTAATAPQNRFVSRSDPGTASAADSALPVGDPPLADPQDLPALPAMGGATATFAAPALVAPPQAWISLTALVLTRADPDGRRLAGTANEPFSDVFNSRAAGTAWKPGLEVRWGLPVSSDDWGFEGSYAYWSSGTSTARIQSDDNALFTAVNFCLLQVGGVCLQDLYENAAEQSFSRSNQFHTVELNLAWTGLNAANTPVSLTPFAGFRWFRFDERALYASAAAGTRLGENGGVTEGYYRDTFINHVFVGQIGARAEWTPAWFSYRSLRFYTQPVVGVGPVYIQRHVEVGRGDGLTALESRASRTDVGGFAQLDVGLSYWVLPSFRVFGGYRGVGLLGVALYDDNVPSRFDQPVEYEHSRSNGSVLLHGLASGVEILF